MTSLGIMTLSRGPYSELDKMSLFQDLKLKRRKVDSRCSSDGESVADTSTSSPDLLTPLSPKMCDLQQQQQSNINNNNNNSSTQTTNINSSSTNSASNQSNGAAAGGGNVNERSNIVVVGSGVGNNAGGSGNNGSGANNSGQTIPLSSGGGGGSGGGDGENNNNNNENNRTSPNSPAILEEIPSTTSNNKNNNAGGNNNNNNSGTSANASVIRSIADERPPPHEPPAIHHHQMHQSQNQMLSQGQQHVTVLVTPSRIKCENQQSGSGGRKQMSSPPTNTTIQLSNSNSSNNNSNNANSTSSSSGNNNQRDVITTSTGSYTPVMIQTGPHSIQMLHPQHSIHHTLHHQQQHQQQQQQQLHHQQMQQQQQQQQQQQHYQQHHQSPTSHLVIQRTSSASSTSSSSGQISPNSPHHHHLPTHHQIHTQHGQLQIPVQLLQQQAQIRVKRERSPSHTSIGQNISLSPTHNPPGTPVSIRHQQSMQAGIQQLISPTGQPLGSNAGLSGLPPHQTIQLRHPISRDAAILFRVKHESQLPTSLSVQTPPHRMVWTSNTRINGVKPEIIGGHLGAIRTSSTPTLGPVAQSTSPQSTTTQQSQQSPRQTPTVIMGESCGVRTMVWGFEPIPPSQTPSPQTPGPSQNNEEAAQLLLSLGQSARIATTEMRNRQTPNRPQHPLNMERLWAGDYVQLPGGQQMHALNLSSHQQWGVGLGHTAIKSDLTPTETNPEDDEQPLVCMICEDKATGLHYGIITCEGCKGFFKRTVQNKRVYTCVADGTCEITKAQRNRCQYCRFKKCIEQGMVLQAVREDRMPGGRNSGAVYNLYKVKYKKHKKAGQKQQNPQQQNPQTQQQLPSPQQQKMMLQSSPGSATPDTQKMFLTPSQQTQIKSEAVSLPSHFNGTILKTALTNPSEIVHLRHRLDNAVSSSKDGSLSYSHSLQMIQTLIECDAMEDIATLPHFSEFLEDKSAIGDKLCNIGDSIVHKLVSWTKKLPFYLDLPVEIHTKLLTDKWHELLILTTAAYQALHGKKTVSGNQTGQTNQTAGSQQSSGGGGGGVGLQTQTSMSGGLSSVPDKNDPEFIQEVTAHLCTLQTCLTTLMGQPITMEQLKVDVGDMVEKMTQITIIFRRIKLKMEEYVCLKVYLLLNKETELESILERYMQVLRCYLQHSAPHNPNRLNEILAHVPEIQAAASLLLESKMFYVPFVLNSASIR